MPDPKNTARPAAARKPKAASVPVASARASLLNALRRCDEDAAAAAAVKLVRAKRVEQVERAREVLRAAGVTTVDKP